MPDSYKQLTFQYIVLTILAVIVLAVGVWAIYAFIRAIYLFIFSHWDAETIKKAYSSIRYMILWIVLTVILLFVFPLIFKWTHFPDAEEYTAKNIFNRAWEVLRTIGDMGTWLKDNQGKLPTSSPQVQPTSKYSL